MADSDISPFSALAGLLGFALIVFGGYFAAGLVGALGGSLAGAAILIVLNHSRTRREGRSFPVHDLQGITPEQAASLLAATPSPSKGERAMPAFKSDIVAQIEQALEDTKGEPRAALARIEQLRDTYPRSAAVWSELVRRRLAVDKRDDAWDALDRALVLALDGGMNSLAAKLAAEFPEGREHLDLGEERKARLERAIEAAR
jgi:hypothetical protein